MAEEIPCEMFRGLTFVLNPPWMRDAGEIEAQRIVSAIECAGGVISTRPAKDSLSLLLTTNCYTISGQSLFNVTQVFSFSRLTFIRQTLTKG